MEPLDPDADPSAPEAMRVVASVGPRLDGVIATLQPSHEFGRVLAAYGGVFVAGSLAWARIVDGYHPDRFDLAGAVICLAGVGVIMYGR